MCRCQILVAHYSRLSLLKKFRVASFQANVTCRFYPLEGLKYGKKEKQKEITCMTFLFHG